VDQRFQMCKATELAEARRGLLEIDRGESVGVGAVGPDTETVEEGLAHQMRRLSRHLADADIDAGLAEEHRLQLRMRGGDVQDARVAETLEVVECGPVGRTRGADEPAGKRGARQFQKIPAADFHTRYALHEPSGFPCPSSASSRWWPGRS